MFFICKLAISIALSGLLLGFSFAALAVDEDELLEPDAAFHLTNAVKNATALVFSWDIARGYYLYRDKIKFISLSPGVELGIPAFPPAEHGRDKFFGSVELFRNSLEVTLPVQRLDSKSSRMVIVASYQGCAVIGVCYLPIRKTVTFDLTDSGVFGSSSITSPDDKSPYVPEQERVEKVFAGNSIGLIMLSFLGFGLLLAFTPCVFPMIPIISGLIAGQGPELTTRKAFGLSFCYVLASAVTYTVFGVVAGFFGKNLQVFFQQPSVIIGVSVVFVLLALSMFGIFNIQMPSFIQSHVALVSSKQRRGSWLGASMMGMLSALTIGPCVTAPLAGALIYIGKSGNAILGGLALFSLGFGMGIPLLVIGTSAGKLMPRAGAWMHVMTTVFGVGLLAVAVWLMGRILPFEIILPLWGSLLVIPLIVLCWKKLWKMSAMLALTYGILLLAGVTTRQQHNYLGLLCKAAIACPERQTLAFKRIGSMAELQQSFTEVQPSGRWVMLEFYADWCVSCQELNHTTFSDPKVRTALSDFLLVQADVTQDDSVTRTLLRRFDLVGPPAVLFFGPDQTERKSYRIIGYMDSEKFLTQLSRMQR